MTKGIIINPRTIDGLFKFIKIKRPISKSMPRVIHAFKIDSFEDASGLD